MKNMGIPHNESYLLQLIEIDFKKNKVESVKQLQEGNKRHKNKMVWA